MTKKKFLENFIFFVRSRSPPGDVERVREGQDVRVQRHWHPHPGKVQQEASHPQDAQGGQGQRPEVSWVFCACETTGLFHLTLLRATISNS